MNDFGSFILSSSVHCSPSVVVMMVDDDGRDRLRPRSSCSSDRLSSPEAPISDSREDEAEDEDEDEVRGPVRPSRSRFSTLSKYNSPELESGPWICRP